MANEHADDRAASPNRTVSSAGPTTDIPSYAELYRLRCELGIDFRKIPLVRGRDRVLTKLIPSSARVLDVGGGNRYLLEQLREAGYRGDYKSLDSDRTLPHEFHSIDEIDGLFDAIVMREFIEHINIPTFMYFARKSLHHLSESGLLLITTPNVFSTWQLCDITHVQHYPFYDLYALLTYIGYYPVQVYRIIPDSRFQSLKLLYQRLHTVFFDLDYAGAILAVARKKCSP